jgi:2-polyprenyl-3-methyl-5-hydroxy-6-metoxy-1,4-benzoquinol methylase
MMLMTNARDQGHVPDATRRAFLDARRESSRRRYDAQHAPTYDQDWGTVSASHRHFLDQLLGSIRDHGTVLDAACGTGKYWPVILASGRTVVGVDQSAGMLEVARSKHPAVPTACVALQDLTYVAAFDAVVCIDALENVGPEDWATVVTALASAVRAGGPLYVTVELADPTYLARVYEQARAAGHPVVPGEDFDGTGYHYYPDRASVLAWLEGAGLEIVDEDEGDDYWHLLLRGYR